MRSLETIQPYLGHRTISRGHELLVYRLPNNVAILVAQASDSSVLSARLAHCPTPQLEPYLLIGQRQILDSATAFEAMMRQANGIPATPHLDADQDTHFMLQDLTWLMIDPPLPEVPVA